MMVLDDLEKFFTSCHERYWKRWKKETSDARFLIPLYAPSNESTDSSGNANLQIFQNTTDKIAVIGRVVINADGFTPAAPYSGGFAALYTGQGGMNTGLNLATVFDYLPLSAGGQVFPNVGEYSGHNALRLRQNETISLFVSGGPASVNISATVWGFLEPLAPNDRY